MQTSVGPRPAGQRSLPLPSSKMVLHEPLQTLNLNPAATLINKASIEGAYILPEVGGQEPCIQPFLSSRGRHKMQIYPAIYRVYMPIIPGTVAIEAKPGCPKSLALPIQPQSVLCHTGFINARCQVKPD